MAKTNKTPTCSVLQQHRCKFKPVLPEILKKGACFVKTKTGKATQLGVYQFVPLDTIEN